MQVSLVTIEWLRRDGSTGANGPGNIAIDPNVSESYLIHGWATGRATIDKAFRHRYTGGFTVRVVRAVYNSVSADCCKAIALSPQVGEAYTFRYQLDALQGNEQLKRYDLDKSRPLDPEGSEGLFSNEPEPRVEYVEEFYRSNY